jgi:hypothetical protein
MKKLHIDSKSRIDAKPAATSFKLTKEALNTLNALTESSAKSSKGGKTYAEVFDSLCNDNTLKKLQKNPPNKEKLNELDRSIVKSFVLNKGILRQLTTLSKHFKIKRDLIVEALVRVPQIELKKPPEREIRLERSLKAFENIWTEFQKESSQIFDAELNYDEDYPFIDLYDLLITFGETFIKHWKLCNSKQIEMDVTIALPTAIDLYQTDMEELNE